MGKTIRIALRALVALGLLGFLLSRAALPRLMDQLAHVDVSLFLAAFGLLCFRNVGRAFRWGLVLRRMDRTEPLSRLTRYIFIGIFFNLLFPTAVGGDIVRGYLLHRRGASRYAAAGSVLLDRFLGLSALACLALVASLIVPDTLDDPFARYTVRSFPFVCIAVALFVFRKPGTSSPADPRRSLLGKLARARALVADQFAGGRARFAAAFLLSLALQVVSITAIFVAARSLGCPEPFAVFASLLPPVFLVSMLPVSIGGFGVREGAFVYFFTSAGMNQEQALAVCLLWVMLMLGQGLVGALLFLLGDARLSEIAA